MSNEPPKQADDAPVQRPLNRRERKVMELRKRAYNKACSNALAKHGSRTLLTAKPAEVVAFAHEAALYEARLVVKRKRALQQAKRRSR